MDRRHVAVAGLLLATVALFGLVSQTSLLFLFTSPSPTDYETATVTVTDENGTTLATVDVRIADTRDKRYTGLSETDSLARDEGMLFVHPSESRLSYVMRNMSFPLDILFVAPNGTITTVRHASVPSDESSEGDLRRYSGRGKYVLEVNQGWANRTGVAAGDVVQIPASARNVSG